MRSFKWLVRARIVLNLALGLLVIAAPALPFEWLHESPPEPLWLVKALGVWLIYAGLAHVAPAVTPGLAMSSSLFVVLGPIVPAALFTWIGLSVGSRALLLLAVYEVVFIVLLSRSFQNGWLAELRTKP